jgi:hypothetical protein
MVPSIGHPRCRPCVLVLFASVLTPEKAKEEANEDSHNVTYLAVADVLELTADCSDKVKIEKGVAVRESIQRRRRAS